MNILINGAGFENKGAEAMLRTVQAEIAERIPDVKFFLWRPQNWDWQPAISSGFDPYVPFDYRKTIWGLVGARMGKHLWTAFELARQLKINCGTIFVNNEKRYVKACEYYLERTLNNIDFVIDVSGYAYADAWVSVLRLQAIRPILTRVLPLMNTCRRLNKRVFFLPQAWGSFNHPKLKKTMPKLLDNPNVVFYSRDESSCRLLEEVLEKPSGTLNTFPDIAFRFKGGTKGQGEYILKSLGCSMGRPIIGIAPNMRVYERVQGEGSSNEYLKALVQLAKHCIENYGADIVLQANEIRGNRFSKDDRFLCSLIETNIAKPTRCFTTRQVLSAEATKALIGHFDFLIGSRFHSLIFALSYGIPGISVSWSHKYRELFSIFGMENDVQECENIDGESLIKMFDQGWNERHQKGPVIRNKVLELQQKIDVIFDDIAEQMLSEKI